MTETKRKPGRPAKPPGEKKVANLTFRVRPQMRDALAMAAEDSGRSTSEEIEYRLTQTFEGGTDRAAELLFGSRLNVHYLTMFAAALESISELARKVSKDPNDEWWDSMLGRAGAAAALQELTASLIAPRDVTLTDDEVQTVEKIKVMAVQRALRQAREDERRERAADRAAGRVDYAKALGLFAEDK